MLMTNEELPEILMDSKTLENAVWRLATKLYQAQNKENKERTINQELNIIAMEIINQENEIIGIITITDLPVRLYPITSYLAPVAPFGIENYEKASSNSSDFPWTSDWGNGLDTFFHLLFKLVLFQTLEEYNPSSNQFIQLTVNQSNRLNDFPLFVSGTVTFPVVNIDDEKDFVCTPKEVITGKSPWKITIS